ncbi:MAG: hypothetical protein ACE5PV_14195 [Candidatus Poribacteria bacterium]
MRELGFIIVGLSLAVSVVICVWGQERLPHGFGLAAKYPGDVGIENDAAVLFAENFERSAIADLANRWDSVSNKDGKVISFAQDAPLASAGERCLQITATRGENNGGHLYTRLSDGVDQAFARFYVKFASDIGYIHHFVHLGGYNPPTPYPQGGAGIRPHGDERITAGIEPFGDHGRFPPPGTWNFYTYWHEMKISADGKYWGNGLRPEQPVLVPRDCWQCVEIMFKCNSAPEQSDGELALWLDGKLQAHFAQGAPRSRWTGMGFKLLEQGGEPFEGFHWRTSNDLKVNFFWLLHYVTERAFRQSEQYAAKHPDFKINTKTATVWFDNIVIAKSYIGPIQRR